MDGILITNNELANNHFCGDCHVVFVDGGYIDVLKAVRDRVHCGHKLLTHPLSGSVKPNENPFKSVFVSHSAGAVHLESLYIIENCIQTALKFVQKYTSMPQSMKDDFRMIDLSLIKSATS